LPAFSYTEWEDVEYDLDLSAALDDEVSGAIPPDSFLITRRVQLAAESVIPVSDDALFIADHAIKAFLDDAATAVDDDYEDMPEPDYATPEVSLLAWQHAVDGDGGASFANWYTIDHHWAAIPAHSIPEGQHAEMFHAPGTVTPNPGIDLYDPYVTPIDDDTQTVTVSWQLLGDTVPDDESWQVDIVVGAFWDGDRPPFTEGTSPGLVTLSINELTHDFVVNKGQRYSVFVQFRGASIKVVGNWVPRGNRVPDPSTLAPSETSYGGRGFYLPETWQWPPGSGTFYNQDTCVLVGSSWATTSQRADLNAILPAHDPVVPQDYTALDAANVRSYQGYWTIKGASTWADHIPPSDAPPETSFEIHTDYGPSATYEYDWTALGTITAHVDGPVRGAPSTPEQPLAAIEMRPSAWAATSALHEWQTLLDLFGTAPVDDVDIDPSDGATVHVATNPTNDDPDLLTPAPMDYAGWSEWGTIRPARLAGTVRLIGQRRVKYASPAVPPLKQRQRVSMSAVHAAQAVAPDPLRQRAQGDL
jgi:hypothetical protein